MQQRNWMDLSRLLVSRFDMNYSFTAVSQALAEYANSWFGEGVVITTQYPDPFTVTMGNMSLGGSVGYGTAFDVNGQLTNITPTTEASPLFTITPNTSGQPRWDLLCIEYVNVGDTLVPKPSDPLTHVFLNLHDDFRLVLIQGTPSPTPAYPAKGNSLYIVLAGIQVPSGATLGTQCTIDYFPRESANANLAGYPVIIQEVPAGAVNGINNQFTMSRPPINAASVLVRVDGRTLSSGADWSLIGQVISVARVLQPGQRIDVWYIVSSATSQNPLLGYQETPAVTPNGVITDFPLVGRPATQASTMVFVDGLEVELAGWSLIQGAICSIQFNAGYIPAPAQSVYVFYLVNPFVVGTQPPPAPPSGSGAIMPYGTAISPVTISDVTGIPATSEQRQLWYVRSAGGPQSITAIPQVTPGVIVGQELYIEGVSSTNYIILSTGNGLSLNGPISLTDNSGILLLWNGSVWSENSRR